MRQLKRLSMMDRVLKWSPTAKSPRVVARVGKAQLIGCAMADHRAHTGQVSRLGRGEGKAKDAGFGQNKAVAAIGDVGGEGAQTCHLEVGTKAEDKAGMVDQVDTEGATSWAPPIWIRVRLRIRRP